MEYDLVKYTQESRLAAGVTQVEVAAKLRPRSYVSKCESWGRRVDVVELAEFARLYRKDLRFFLDLAYH